MLPTFRGRHRWRPLVLLVLAGLLATMSQVVGGAPATAVETRSPVVGTVRLSTGDAASGSVTIYRLDPAPDAGYDFYAGDSIEGGVFDVDLEPGTYKFLFRSWAGNSSRWYATGGATGADIDNATPVVLSGSPRDLGLTTIPVRAVTVLTKDQAGNPIADVELEGSYALSWDDPAYEDRCDWNDWSETGTDGVAVFVVPMNCELAFQSYADGVHEPGNVTVPAGTNDVEVPMTMPRRATISGTVTADGGAGVGGVGVIAYDVDGDERSDTETAPDGTFTLVGLPAGDYTLRFVDRLGDFVEEYYDNAADLAGADYFTVAANTDVTGKNASLAVAPPSPTGDRDLTGVVHGTDGPLSAVRVTAYRNGIVKARTLTGRDGRYEFDALTAGSYQLRYERLSGWSSELPYSTQWYLNSRSSGSSTPVSVTPDAPGADRNVTLQQWGAITGTLTDDGGNPVEYPYFGALDVDMYEAERDVMDSAPGTYTLALPPGTYHVSYNGYSDEGDTSYIQEYWKDSSSVIGSTPVVVTSGVVKSGFNVELTDKLQNKTVPKVSGTPLVGRTLTASTGTWNLMADNQYVIEWLRGSTPVATGPSYVLKAADAGKKLTARVTATHGDLTGTALSAATATVKRPSVTSFTGTSPASRKVRLAIAISGTGLTNPGGTVAIKRGTRIVKTGVAVVNGKAVVTLASQPAGSQRYQVVYSGTAVVNASTSVVKTIVVRR